MQLTSGNVNSEITLKESFHHGVAVPLSLEDYEKELAREKDLLTKAKKKISMESSTPKEGISTWILLSGSNNPTTTSRPEVNKPAYRVDNDNKKPVVKSNIGSTNSAVVAWIVRVSITINVVVSGDWGIESRLGTVYESCPQRSSRQFVICNV